MFAVEELFGSLLLIAVVCFQCSDAIGASPANLNSQEWLDYKTKYNKTYTDTANTELAALFYYNYNKKLIASYNLAANQRNYRLAVNQFTDMRLIHFNALFPKSRQPTTTFASKPPGAQAPPMEFDPTTDLGLVIEIEDQGTVCNSGWAYATAKAVEILAANQMGLTTPNPLSAQNLIDCAGSGTGCTRQVPQTAFDYLVGYNQLLYTKAEYPNANKQLTQGMCLPPANSTGTAVGLAEYARITDVDDTTLMKYVAAGYPVVIEFDPTSFEFMHYASGIFQQPQHRQGGSHYMTVIGYGTDMASNLNYWLVLNSFGTTWGENGYIRIIRGRSHPLTEVALFPTTLAP